MCKIVMLASSREINFNDVLALELAAYPPSMFNADGKNERRHVQIISERNCPISDTMIYDVSVLLWVITWPTGKPRVYVDAIKAFVHQS